MAVAAAVTERPNLLLMAKLIALCLLLTNHVRLLTEPFLPFVSIFDRLPGPAFLHTLQIVFVGSAAALLFNRSVRLSSLLLGLTILVGIAASKAYFGNNKFFCGCVLFLTGLQPPGKKPWLLRWQLAIVYFGAGLNKALDADWHSGQFFEYWATHRVQNHLYIWAARWLPPMALARLMCWTTIGTELGLSAGFLVPRLYPLAIWGNLLFQSALLLFTGTTFTMFFYAMTAASLAFVEWPRSPLLVIYDGDCGFCNRTKEWIERLDLEGRFEWEPLQTGAARRYGITDEAVQQRLHLVAGEKIYAGFAAFQKMLLYNPVFYFAAAVLLAAPPARASLYRDCVVLILLAFFFPLFSPIGEAAYNLVARNRHRLSAQPTCKVG
jgi:predicted DCC family thiol-disulfide oxidoreductase YuxK